MIQELLKLSLLWKEVKEAVAVCSVASISLSWPPPPQYPGLGRIGDTVSADPIDQLFFDRLEGSPITF